MIKYIIKEFIRDVTSYPALSRREFKRRLDEIIEAKMYEKN